jgi:hypothetical protein
MIDAREVLDAVEGALADALDDPVRLFTAPAGAPAAYVVVEVPPGTARTGTLGDPEQDAELRVRLRASARYVDVAEASRAAMSLATAAAAALLDRTVTISGSGWEITGREQIADGGIDHEGPIANHTADFTLHVAKASA